MGKNVLIAASRDVLRAGLVAVFSKDIRVSKIDVVETYQHLKKRLCRSNGPEKPDLIIIDQSLSPDLSELPRGAFVILAPQFDIQVLREAHRHGACGYVLESVSEKLLLTLLEPNESFFLIEPTLIPQVLDRFFTSNIRMLMYVKEELLTTREREIVHLLRDGVDRSTIAEKLCIAETTLKTHIKNIARKR